MRKNTLKVNVLTPIWTGNSDMMPNGLKMSGIIGSIRYIFESLIRWQGGHTCDITGDPKHRCNYEKDKNICPACAVFGCTGWARTFKINWNLDPFNRIGTIILPETDVCSRFRNRNHEEACYSGNTSIDTWLATAVKEDRGTIPPTDHAKARNVLNRMRPAYAADLRTRKRTGSELEILVLRELPGCDIGKLIAGLLSYMSSYYAIGAKVNQGWGFFDIPEGYVEEDDLVGEISKLIAARKSFTHDDWDAGLLNAEDIPYLDPVEVDISSLFDQFQWQNSVSLSRYPYDFIPLGFALQYRLRRIVKFWNLDREDSDPDCYFDLLGKGGKIDDWEKSHKKEISGYQSKHPISWQREGAFAEYLFGKSFGNDKNAGKIGVSHPYLQDGKWYVRMISTAEWDYAESLYEILKDQLGVEE